MSDPLKIKQHFEIKFFPIQSLFSGEESFTTDAYTVRDAIKNLVMRLGRRKNIPESKLIPLANKLYETNKFYVMSQTPILPENPKPFTKQEPGAKTLREIGKEMDEQNRPLPQVIDPLFDVDGEESERDYK